MIPANAMKFAMKYCESYPEHSLSKFIFNGLSYKTEMVTEFLLVQYKIEDNKRIFISMFFNYKYCDMKLSSSRIIKRWFSMYENEYLCTLTNVSSIRKYIMRMS